MQTLSTFCKTSYRNEEVNRTEPSPSVTGPCLNTSNVLLLKNVFFHSCLGQRLTRMKPEAVFLDVRDPSMNEL